MAPRPRAITLVAWVFILAGAAGLLNDLWPLVTPGAAEHLARIKADGLADFGPAWATRALAIVGGIGVLWGRNWARWLLAAWMLFHIGTSVLHSMTEVLMHTVIFAPLAFVLFRRASAPYFRADGAISHQA